MKVTLAILAQSYAPDADTNIEWVRLVGRIPANGLPTTLRKLPAAV